MTYSKSINFIYYQIAIFNISLNVISLQTLYETLPLEMAGNNIETSILFPKSLKRKQSIMKNHEPKT